MVNLKGLVFKSAQETGLQGESGKPTVSADSIPLPSPSRAVERPSYLGSTPRTRARSATVGTVVVPAPGSAVDPEFDTKIRAALDQAKSRGYREFLDQMDILVSAIPDSVQRAAMALKSVTRMLGLTSEQVRGAVRERLDILEQERAQFSEDIATEAKEMAESSGSAVEDLRRKIGDLDSQIKQLTAEREQLKGQCDAAEQAAQLLKANVEAVRSRFAATYQFHKDILVAVQEQVQ